MGKVALAINQQKRTKELLSRYMNTTAGKPAAGSSSSGGGFIHSLEKKGGRLVEALRAGMSKRASESQDARENVEFNASVKRLESLQKAVKVIRKCVLKHRDQLRAHSRCLEECGKNLVPVFKDSDALEMAAAVKNAMSRVANAIEVYCSAIEPKVIGPLTSLLPLFSNPLKLIDKRADKRLDFERAKRKYRAVGFSARACARKLTDRVHAAQRTSVAVLFCDQCHSAALLGRERPRQTAQHPTRVYADQRYVRGSPRPALPGASQLHAAWNCLLHARS